MPASSRLMLLRWRHSTSTVVSRARPRYGQRSPSPWSANQPSISSGRASAATTLDRDTMRLRLSTAKKMPKQASPTGQVSPSNMPRPVATALPPFQPSHTGQMWPASAARPASTTPTPKGSSRVLASSTAAAPLSTSTRNTARAGPLPTTRSTLVAPVEPEPSRRMSRPASQRPAR